MTARLNLNKLYFDLNGPGVADLYNEMKHIHRRKQNDGELKLVRDLDDRTAALEDAIEALDGKALQFVPKTMNARAYPKTRKKAFARAL